MLEENVEEMKRNMLFAFYFIVLKFGTKVSSADISVILAGTIYS